MTKRSPGLDLIRCLAFMFVVLFHFYLNNGYYVMPQTGALMWLTGSFRWGIVSCIGLFLMLTGYLQSEKLSARACWRGLPTVLLGYLLAALISIPIRHFLLGDARSMTTWSYRLVGFTGAYYGWYVEMYLGLILLCPFLNMILRQLQTTRALLGFTAVLLILTALPGTLPWPLFPDYWRSFYPVTYYVLGAVVRRLQPKLRPWIGIAAAAAIALLLGTVTVLSTDGPLSEAVGWEFSELPIAMIALCLFVALYRIQPPKGVARVLATASGGVYGGYLLSHLLDCWCYKLFPQWWTPACYPLLFLCVSVPIWLLSLLAGIGLDRLTKLLLRPLIALQRKGRTVR